MAQSQQLSGPQPGDVRHIHAALPNWIVSPVLRADVCPARRARAPRSRECCRRWRNTIWLGRHPVECPALAGMTAS
eukprot:400433-Pyramimonas_sp.AAC.1